jgi:hypothetical protein
MDNQATCSTGQGLLERRRSTRFPIRQAVTYRVIRQRFQLIGSGEVIDISRHGVFFTTEEPLSPGLNVEVTLNWPVLLNGTCALKLIVSGRVVRSERSRVAVGIERYEFHTRGTRSAEQSRTADVGLGDSLLAGV